MPSQYTHPSVAVCVCACVSVSASIAFTLQVGFKSNLLAPVTHLLSFPSTLIQNSSPSNPPPSTLRLTSLPTTLAPITCLQPLLPQPRTRRPRTTAFLHPPLPSSALPSLPLSCVGHWVRSSGFRARGYRPVLQGMQGM